MTVRLRPAVPDDTDRLAQLHRRSFARGWSRAEIGGFLGDPHSHTIIAQNDAASCAGFVIARQVAEEAEILTIAVDPDQRRQGLGRALMSALLRRLSETGASVLFLEVAADNKAARGLYGHYGFITIGRRTAYYSSQAGPVDGLTLTCDLPHAADRRL